MAAPLAALVTIFVFAKGEASPGILRDPAFLQALNEHHFGLRAFEDYGARAYGSSRPSAPESPSTSTENSSGYRWGNYWRPKTASAWTGNITDGYPALRGEVPQASRNRDSTHPGRLTFRYRQAGPGYKKIQPSYFKDQVRYKGIGIPGKPTTYARIPEPYVKHKHPVRPSYRRYYRSPFQKYPLSSADLWHSQIKKQSDSVERDAFYEPSAPAAAQASTTATAKDGAPRDYYENYEEAENAAEDLPPAQEEEETTTRGYYGDRIYMRAQTNPEGLEGKAAAKRKYYIVRRTFDNDDDIETLFE